MDITLYHAPDSRSGRIVWLLEEIGAPYTLVYTDIVRRSGAGASDPRNPHPDKHVPALVIDGSLVTECAAIAQMLTESFPAAGLGAGQGERDRAAYLTWLAFHAGEVEPAFAATASGRAAADPFLARACRRVADRVAQSLARGPFLMGHSLSAADVLVSAPFEWCPALANGHSGIAAWIARLMDRPAARRARELDVPPAGVTQFVRVG